MECSFPDCGRPRESLGLCASHYAQRRAGKPLEPIRPYRARADLAHVPKGERRRVIMIAHEYGVTHEEALELARHPSCMVCGRSRAETSKALNVDHDHDSGHIRGVLCGDCNRAAGLLRESPEIARSLADYLSAAPRLRNTYRGRGR